MRDWNTLLNSGRFRKTNKNKLDERSEFQRDYDRIIYCSAFRRLQDKTQVYPLEKYDYVRTRLTHSLEVSSLGRSFGIDIALKLYEKKLVKEDYKDYFSNILSAVCLIHDIGNPPFGHCGEYIIQSWFKTWFANNSNKVQSFSPSEKLDFMRFEGNAQALRILTKLQFLKDEHGLNLTYATLASLVKYPISSGEAYKINDSADKIEVEKKEGATYKKFGYFQSEKDRFNIINEKTCLNRFRHPLVYLMEAADDIAYSAADIEDAHKKNSINFELIYTEFKNSFGIKDELVKKFLKEHKDSKKSGFPDPEDLTMQKVRIDIQAKLIRNCIDSFIDNYEKIMEGSYYDSLINSNDDSKEIFKILTDKIGINYIYNDKEIIMQELVGNKVISGLLDIFIPAVLNNGNDNILGKYYNLLSPNFRYIMNTFTDETTYNKLQFVTDFICGMTDSYALDLYQKLSGVKPI